MGRRAPRIAGLVLAALLLVGNLGFLDAGPGGVTAGGGQSDAAVESLMQEFGMRPLSGHPPPLALPGLDGRRYALASLKGRVGLLYFWASW